MTLLVSDGSEAFRAIGHRTLVATETEGRQRDPNLFGLDHAELPNPAHRGSLFWIFSIHDTQSAATWVSSSIRRWSSSSMKASASSSRTR